MIRHRVLFGCLVVSLAFVVGQRVAADETPVWKPLVDGKTMAGWHKNGDGEWTIEEGAYIGRSDNAKLYGHLVTDDTFQDFTVRFDFLCSSGDSGFFIRTEMQEPDKTLGLQVQVGPLGSGTGGIYESYGRAWLQKPSDELEKCGYRQGRWSEMMISAHGPRVTVHVNGVKTADLDDPQLSLKAGVFALQMHSGVVNDTRFKDIAILEKGAITPKQFLGADAPVIKAGTDGTLSLSAAAGLGIGPEVRYMPEWAAFGYMTGKDRLEWPMEVATAGQYEVQIVAAASEKQAGQGLTFAVGEAKLTTKVPSTGGVDKYQSTSLGTLELSAGVRPALLVGADAGDRELPNVREIKLVSTAGKSDKR
jgi:hypothetical protein